MTTVETFTALYTRYHAPLVRFLRPLVGDLEAEDLAQETWLKLWRALGAGVNVEAASWLFKAAQHTAIDALRRRRLIAWQSLEASAAGEWLPVPGSNFDERVATCDAIRQVLSALGETNAAALLAADYAGYPHATIAAALGSSHTAMKMRIARARERFIMLYRAEVAA